MLLLPLLLLLGLGADAVLAEQRARDWVVDSSSADAIDRGPGTAATPFATIGAAARAARPGDSVLVHGGTVNRAGRNI